MPSVCDTYAYCLMPNHIHFLIKIHPEELLVKHPKFKSDFHKLVMQALSNMLNSYAKAYNKMYNRKGGLWIDFTKRFMIESDSYLTSTINYIHQNPVKHGFCIDPTGWKYSSYSSIVSEKPTLLKREEIINWFGNTQSYLNYHLTETTKLLEEWE